MLTFLTGTYFSAKKKYIDENIAKLLRDGKRVYLIVPEQSSFDRDRDFLFKYKEELSNRLTVSSFTHLARDVLEENGFSVKPEADEAAKNVIMSLAVQECGDSLEIYSNFSSKNGTVSRLLGEYTEIRGAGLETADLDAVSSTLPEGTLKNKTRELALIFSAYEAMLTERFSDVSDNLAVMTRFLEQNPVFDNAYIFFDDFRGFTGAQIKLLSVIISQAKECFISVGAPDSLNSYDSQAFVHAVKNCKKIRAVAALNSVKCREIKISDEHPSAPLRALNASLFCAEKDVFEEKCECVKICKAENKYDECDLVALEIKKLLKKGYRCRDISVCERSGKYLKPLVASLKKYGVPVFCDMRVPLGEYPLVRMLLSAVDIASHSLQSDTIFSYLKTGIAGIDDEECAMLENYVYIWQIDNGAWLKPFSAHPDGFGEELDERAEERLKKLEEIRLKTVEPLLSLKKRLSCGVGGEECKAVYEFLVETHAAENFKKYAQSLFDGGNEAGACECARVWDYVMQALDALHEILENRNVSPRRFCELLKIMLTSGDIGRIPAGIDEIVIGEAGRTRHLEPRAVFVLGCNEGAFPMSGGNSGLFSANEKRILEQGGFSLEGIPESFYAEERMVAYSVLSNVGELLFVSYSEADSNGSKTAPSEIITEIREVLPLVDCISFSDMTPMEKAASEESAFEQCAAHFSDNTVFSQSLKEYVSGGEFSSRLAVLEEAASGARAKISDEEIATSLFGKDMYISPSKAEMFYTCAFKYFCRYGMNVQKLSTANFDSRINGLLIHHLLEHILVEHTNAQLIQMSQKELREEIDAITEEFIEKFMGGRQDKSVLMNRSLDRTKENAFDILSRMILEFSESRFETVDVELQIGENAPIPTYRLSLPDSGSISVGGKVDRVDIMKDGEMSYFRVVDYKTGGKEFKLSDVFDGKNMQMLIYLMGIWDGGEDRYGKITPAGILYVPANNYGKMLKRNASEKEIAERKLENGRMNGMILENLTVLKGMEESCGGKFVNASADESGKMKGTFLSLAGFKALHEKIDDMLKNMGVSLHKGDIAAVPLMENETKSPCKYCDYKDICRRSEDGEFKKMLSVSHASACEMLLGGKKDVAEKMD